MPDPPLQLNYQAPASDLDSVRLARLQKGLIHCIISYAVCFVAGVLIGIVSGDVAGIALALEIVGVGGIAFYVALIYFTIRLGNGLFPGPQWIALMILLFIPWLAIVSVLIINRKVTGILKQSGFRIGFFGARLTTARPPR